jgi:hypothetical protein
MRPPRSPGLGFLFLLLAACGPAGERGGAAPAEPGPPAGPPSPLARLEALDGTLAWNDLALGMSHAAVERVLGRELPLSPPGPAACAWRSVDAEVDGTPVHLSFGEREGELKLESLRIELTGARSRDELVRLLKRRVPPVRYQPGRHQPDLAEDEDETPLYVYTENEELGLLLKPDRALFVTRVGCLD